MNERKQLETIEKVKNEAKFEILFIGILVPTRYVDATLTQADADFWMTIEFESNQLEWLRSS